MKYNNVIKNIMVCVSLALSSSVLIAQTPTASPKNAAAQEINVEKDWTWTFEVGGQYRDVSGERPSKFEEYKSVRNVFLVRRAAVDYNPAGSPRFFSFVMRNASERDQQYAVEVGKYGRFKTAFTFDSQPHLYARGAATLFANSGDGLYTVADSIQQNIQALDPPPTGNATPPNPALIAAVKSYVSTADRFDLRSQRHTLSFEQRFDITNNWSLRFHFLETRRTGQRPLGTGSYERTPTANNTGDVFRVHGVELPADIDQRTDNFSLGTSYLTKDWGVNFDLHFSNFDNNIDSYIYDNPFRLTDQPTTGSAGAFNRMAFARGLHGTMPDNTAIGFMVSAFVNLPMDSRWAGVFGWERFKQNEQFLPFTLNTAITNQPAGVVPTSTVSMPQQSLEGSFENITVDQLFTTRPFKNFNINLHYRAYDENNKTPELHFPGYAAYLEAWWRPSIAGTYGTRLIENEPASYLRQRASSELVWDISKKVRWRGEYEWEGWNRSFRQVSRTNEHKFGTFFSFKPTMKFKADVDYRYQKRTPQFYFPGPLENQELRMFDQAERERNYVNVKLQWAATPKIGFSGDFAYLNDDYPETKYGTTGFREYRYGLDLLYNFRENTTFYVNYSREHYKTQLQSIAKTGTPAFDERNRWSRDDRNVNDNVGIGVSTYMNQSKWFLDVNYAMNYGKDLITTTNVSTPAPSAFNNAIAYPFPEAKYRYQEFSLDTNYQIMRNAAIGIRYLYEPFSLNDWQWNTMSPYPYDELAPETDGRRFLLLDSRYTDHNAHVISVYIRFGN